MKTRPAWIVALATVIVVATQTLPLEAGGGSRRAQRRAARCECYSPSECWRPCAPSVVPEAIINGFECPQTILATFVVANRTYEQWECRKCNLSFFGICSNAPGTEIRTFPAGTHAVNECYTNRICKTCAECVCTVGGIYARTNFVTALEPTDEPGLPEPASLDPQVTNVRPTSGLRIRTNSDKIIKFNDGTNSYFARIYVIESVTNPGSQYHVGFQVAQPAMVDEDWTNNATVKGVTAQ